MLHKIPINPNCSKFHPNHPGTLLPTLFNKKE